MSQPLDVLYEDNHCLAVNKPAGLLTQGVPPGIPTLEALAKAYLKERYHKPGNVYLGIPHRLDRPVSGVVLFARNTKAAQRLAEQFQERRVEKIYWALVKGKVQPQEGTWTDSIVKHQEQARAEIVAPDTAGARHAQLQYRLLGEIDDLSWLEVRPLTGRMHQIRAQFASRGHPILGDEAYGSDQPFSAAATPRERAIALHARSLRFLHPIRYEPITVEALIPKFWLAAAPMLHDQRRNLAFVTAGVSVRTCIGSTSDAGAADGKKRLPDGPRG
jgi:23S rRNA pseudouridine1911/1915/1917 synthase